MKSLLVKLSEKNYHVYIENDLLDHIGSEIKKIYRGRKIAIITDENVNNFYGERIKNSLEKSNYLVHTIVVEPGEKSKSINTLAEVFSKLLDFGITKSDLIIAFGGGVTGDLGGFAASTLLRGIPLIQVPTSLLAQVDSSIGGKVAIDMPKGKNLIGSFYHPEAVFIDPLLLKTLDRRFLYDGMAEVIKYGCIKNRDLFDKLMNIGSEKELFYNIEEIIYSCCRIKRDIVERDEKDLGERMILNFGHTIGHAIEKCFDFTRYTHGEAVAIGMHTIIRKSEEDKMTPPGMAEAIRKNLRKYNLPFELPQIKKEEIIKAINLDKKSRGEYIDIILLKDIGEGIIKSINKEEIVRFV